VPSPNPNRYRENAYARLAYVNRHAQLETYTTGNFQLVAGFLKSVEASMAVNDQVAAFAQAFQYLTSHSKIQLAQVHTAVGRLMQAAVLEDYAKSKASYGRNVPAYRLSTRDAGGKMEAAMGSNIFFRGTQEGIGFVNVELMDAVARQWHRLNFGARPAGNYTPRLYKARFGNLVAGSFGFVGESPSPGFGLPQSFFWQEGMLLRPRGKQVGVTRGIRAWNFLDAGPRVMAEQLGIHYDGLYRDWYASAQKGLGPLSKVANVPPPRRRSFRP
jgi:hypothetical protein